MRRDDLGDRMKRNYENRTRIYLPRRTYTVVRVDGKAFHFYTRDCRRPFDADLMADMDAAALALCREIEGARLALVQSDEISVLLTDFGSAQTEAWFDGNLQKIVSLSASIATAAFNAARRSRATNEEKLAYFDSRAFTIPEPGEVFNYFLWRQQDATRNSIAMAAQSHFRHEELAGKSSDALQEMLWRERGVNWNDYPDGFKRGRCVVRSTVVKDAEFVDGRTGETRRTEGVERRVWEVVAPPVFSRDRDWLLSRIPRHE